MDHSYMLVLIIALLAGMVLGGVLFKTPLSPWYPPAPAPASMGCGSTLAIGLLLVLGLILISNSGL
jgi:hypothetical protein